MRHTQADAVFCQVGMSFNVKLVVEPFLKRMDLNKWANYRPALLSGHVRTHNDGAAEATNK